MRPLLVATFFLAIGAAVAANPPPKLAAPDRTVFGIQLGSPLTIPECPMKGDGVLRRMDTAAWASHPITCLKGQIGSSPDPSVKRYDLQFAPDEWPKYLYEAGKGAGDNYVGLMVVNGNVEQVVASTDGAAVQQDILDRLTKKYGKATEQATSPVQTMMGASFQQVSAIWDFKDLYVLFQGFGNKVTSGTLAVSTPTARAADARQKQTNDANSKERQL